jgi:hypothetical protein
LDEGKWGTIPSLGKAVQKKTPIADKKVKKFPFKPVYTTKTLPAKVQYYSTARAMQRGTSKTSPYGGGKWWLAMQKAYALKPTEVR